MDACGILTIKHSLALITNMAQKQNEHCESMWSSDNQALTSCDHKHGTEAEWAPWTHVEFWQSSTHFLWPQKWHRSRMSTMDTCGILTIKHSLSLIRNMAQKQNEYCGCMWNSDNQILTSCDYRSKMSTVDACGILTITHSLALIKNMAQKQNEHCGCMWNSDNQSTHILWSPTWHKSRMRTVDACGILTIKHSLAVITNMAQKQNEHCGCMWNFDNQALTSCDHKHGIEAEWALQMHVEFWQLSTH